MLAFYKVYIGDRTKGIKEFSWGLLIGKLSSVSVPFNDYITWPMT